MLDTIYLFSYAFFMFFSGWLFFPLLCNPRGIFKEAMCCLFVAFLKKVCGRADEFALLLELGDDIQVSQKKTSLMCKIISMEEIWPISSGISTWLFGFSYVVGIHNLWYLLIVQVPKYFEEKTLAYNISYKIYQIKVICRQYLVQNISKKRYILADNVSENIAQIVTGCFQASGWPGVVSVMANWFGKVNIINRISHLNCLFVKIIWQFDY